MSVYQLTPVLINQKSFYGKAIVEDNDIEALLKSYYSIVCCYSHATNTIRVYKNTQWYTSTTLKHIREFLYQMTGYAYSKKELREFLV